MPYRLRTLDQQHTVELHPGLSSIGTDPANTVPVHAEFGLAPQHFTIQTELGRIWIEDRTGGPGTLINGQPIRRHELTTGDIIRAGSLTMIFMGEEQCSTPSSKPLQASFDYRAAPVPPPTAITGAQPGFAAVPAPPAAERHPSAPLPIPKPEVTRPSSRPLSPAPSGITGPVDIGSLEFFRSSEAPLRMHQTGGVPLAKHTGGVPFPAVPRVTGPIPRITGGVPRISALVPPPPPGEPQIASITYKAIPPVPAPGWTVQHIGQPEAAKASTAESAPQAAKGLLGRLARWIGGSAAFGALVVYRHDLFQLLPVELADKLSQILG